MREQGTEGQSLAGKEGPSGEGQFSGVTGTRVPTGGFRRIWEGGSHGESLLWEGGEPGGTTRFGEAGAGFRKGEQPGLGVGSG